jgi:hypothetical protein
MPVRRTRDSIHARKDKEKECHGPPDRADTNLPILHRRCRSGDPATPFTPETEKKTGDVHTLQ